MCVKEIFTDIRPDGRLRTWSEGDYCANSARGQFCDRTQELRHPPGYRRSESRSPAYNRGQLPPTPPLSYHSDYTSDSERSSKRRSGIYINDNRVIDVNRRRSLRHERHGSGDRIVYVGSSPLSRTPPLYQRSIPSSPVTDAYDTYEHSYRDGDEHSRSRERPTSIKVEIINERPKSHRRQGSSSKTNSSRDSNEEERRQRRLSDVHHGDHQRHRRKESEIARQNEAIASRIPVPHAPPSPRYRRGSVAIVPTISVQDRMRLKEAEVREREEEAQNQRLKDRFKFKSFHH